MTSEGGDAGGVGAVGVLDAAGGHAGVALDAVQERAVAWPRGRGALLVLGAPGTGRSRVAVEAAVRRALAVVGRRAGARQDGGVLLLSPQRVRADALAVELGRRLAGTGAQVEVRTPSGIAFEVVRRHALAHGLATPALLSGADVDSHLADLLAGHAAGAGLDPGWGATVVPEAALALPAFRDELRDLLTRAAQEGLSPADLAALGRAHARPEWISAARVMLEFEQTLALRDEQGERRRNLDHARVMTEAAHHLATWRDEFDEPGPHWSAVVVDDYQDATPALTALLRQFAADGAQLILTADPDLAVQQFRGGSALLAGEAPDPIDAAHPTGLGASVLRLPTAHRGHPDLVRGLDLVRRHLPTTRTGGAHRRVAFDPPPAPGGDPGARAARPHARMADEPRDRAGAAGVQLAVVSSPTEEADLIARRLREEHLLAGTPWDAMAVLTRSSGQVARLRAALRTADVPTDADSGALPLPQEPAVRPLLDVLHVALALRRRDDVETERVRALLQSAVGGLSAVQVRVLVRALRVLGDEGDDPADVLVRAVRDPEAVLPDQVALIARQDAAARSRAGAGGADADGPAVRQGVLLSAVRGLLRVSRAVADAAAAAERADATVSTVLWAAWNRTGLAGLWQGVALAGGPGSERAHGDLDAVMALFAAAERHDERHAGEGVSGFLATIEAQEVPQDTLAARGRRGGAVTVQTAASAVGRSFAFVVVAGVQEGSWPDMRIRDTLLGAVDLVDAVRRGGAGRRGAREKRSEVLADELRLFVAALSRADRLALVTAVADADEAPSMFFEALAPDVEIEALRVQVPAPLTLRGLVGRLRSAAETGAAALLDEGEDTPGAPGGARGELAEESVRTGRAAATLLGALAEHGVTGAHPARWYGYAPVSTAQALVPEDERVLVSPSAVAGAQQCALRWLLTRHGGERGGGEASRLGTLVHALAQEHPVGPAAVLQDALDRRLPELGYDRDTWAGRRAAARVEAMVARLAGYVEAEAAALGPEPSRRIRTEVAIPAADIGARARISGRTDRLEQVGGEGADRRWRVVDFKTGASPMKPADALRDPQLALYQVGVPFVQDADGAPLGRAEGARLVYLGAGARAAQRTQEPLADADDPALPEGRFTMQDAVAVIDDAARVMGGAEFRPTPGEWCRTCPVRSVCPAPVQGE